MITACQPSMERLVPFQECMNSYDVEGGDSEFPWNILSLRTKVYSCGAIYREGDNNTIHNHDPEEFALCQRLANDAAEIMEGVAIEMGSTGLDYFSPFFVVANVGIPSLQEITADGIRDIFNATIYPSARIWVEPFDEQGEWWSGEYGVNRPDDDFAPDEQAERLRPWQSLIRWFADQPELREASFVAVGEESLDDENGACVFPRLIVGLTEAGSLVGIVSRVVYA